MYTRMYHQPNHFYTDNENHQFDQYKLLHFGKDLTNIHPHLLDTNDQ